MGRRQQVVVLSCSCGWSLETVSRAAAGRARFHVDSESIGLGEQLAHRVLIEPVPALAARAAAPAPPAADWTAAFSLAARTDRQLVEIREACRVLLRARRVARRNAAARSALEAGS
jgi:hypothetical protein